MSLGIFSPFFYKKNSFSLHRCEREREGSLLRYYFSSPRWEKREVYNKLTSLFHGPESCAHFPESKFCRTSFRRRELRERRMRQQGKLFIFKFIIYFMFCFIITIYNLQREQGGHLPQIIIIDITFKYFWFCFFSCMLTNK